jgi:hypothetical protein
MSVQWEGHMRHVSNIYPVSYYSPRWKIAFQPCPYYCTSVSFECTSAIAASHYCIGVQSLKETTRRLCYSHVLRTGLLNLGSVKPALFTATMGLITSGSDAWCRTVEYRNFFLKRQSRTRQCTWNVILRRVRLTIVALEKQSVLRILECVFVALPAVPYFSILSHKRYDFGKKKLLNTKCVSIFCTIFVWKISHSKKNWAR